MLKQSYLYLVLQIINIFMGLFVTLYIAQNVDAKTFAIFAIYIIVTTLFTTFSFSGYETVLIRNVLHWQNTKQIIKIKNLISYALISRSIISVFLSIPISVYLYYISIYKFDNQYFLLLSSFILAGFFSALTNSNALILKAFNNYILSFSIMTLSSLFGRLIGIFVFVKIGFNGFLITLIIVPIVSFIISFLWIRKFFSFKNIKFKYLSKFKKYKYFTFSGYLNYFKVSLDQFLVSILLSVEILAVYNLAKRVQEIGRSFIEGFFDPIIQKIIAYKTNIDKSLEYKRKIYLIKNVFLGVVIIFVIIFDLYIDKLINLAELNTYKNLNYYLIFASWTSIIYLIYKIEVNIVYLFEDQKKLFKIDIFIAIINIVMLLLFFILLNEKYIYLNVVITGLLQAIFFLIYFKKYFYSNSIFQGVKE